ncbi:IS3 family transposase [Paenibacillus sp. FSL A5-0031]|uniref:IS3 family transposase n=1 Tax=Paenibacillus sp. FSL A5-0031 TaxID=1920420 RepID=UPI0035564B73
MKGCPYDNAVAEAIYKVMKTEFVNHMTFQSFRYLALGLYDYVNWFNQASHQIGYKALLLLFKVVIFYDYYRQLVTLVVWYNMTKSSLGL